MAHLKTIIALIFFLTSFISYANLSDYNGKWRNIDEQTKGVTEVLIKATDANSLSIQVWGKCHPKNCNWGTNKSVAFAPSVSSSLRETTSAILSIYSFSHSLKTIVIKPLVYNKKISIEVFTEFPASDTRTDYYSIYYLERIEE